MESLWKRHIHSFALRDFSLVSPEVWCRWLDSAKCVKCEQYSSIGSDNGLVPMVSLPTHMCVTRPQRIKRIFEKVKIAEYVMPLYPYELVLWLSIHTVVDKSVTTRCMVIMFNHCSTVILTFEFQARFGLVCLMNEKYFFSCIRYFEM